MLQACGRILSLLANEHFVLMNSSEDASYRVGRPLHQVYAKSFQSCPNLCADQFARLLVRDSPDANTGVGVVPFSRRSSLTQGWTRCLSPLLHLQADSLPLVPPGRTLFIRRRQSQFTKENSLLQAVEGCRSPLCEMKQCNTISQRLLGTSGSFSVSHHLLWLGLCVL